METIKIAHLYYDLMNLYGENGNVRVLARHLEKQNLKVIIHFLTIDDSMDFSKYDIIYIGSGSTENFLLALQDLKKYKNQLKKAINTNTLFLVTGNAINLFGQKITLADQEEMGLEVFSYDTLQTDFRIVGEQTVTYAPVKESIIGFQNRDTVLKNINEPHLFEVLEGTGYMPKSNFEGIHKNNFYGTFLLGPILARNPHFTEYLVKEIMNQKNLIYKKHHDLYETKAYQEYMRNKQKK